MLATPAPLSTYHYHLLPPLVAASSGISPTKIMLQSANLHIRIALIRIHNTNQIILTLRVSLALALALAD